MANIKRLYVSAIVPFNLHESARMSDMLNVMCGPCCGLKYRYSEQPVGVTPSEHGGQTQMYGMTISGEEAVASDWINCLMDAIDDCGGRVLFASYSDIEAHEGPFYWDTGRYSVMPVQRGWKKAL